MYKIILTFILSVLTCSVYAHAGRTNSEGCHNNRKTGDYHCHGGGSSRHSSASTSSSNKMYCKDFDTQDAAQEYFDGHPRSGLDRDGDGVACESHFGGGSSEKRTDTPSTSQVYSVATLPPESGPQDVSGSVVGITDGDTLTVLDASNTQHKIRLSSIDAPEMDQPFGQSSKKALSDICYNRQAYIKYVDTDRYGRMVGDVQCDGKDAAIYLLENGQAWVYDKYSANYQFLYQYQDLARSEGLGLWSNPRVIAPWEWRQGKRDNARAVDKDNVIEKVLGDILKDLF